MLPGISPASQASMHPFPRQCVHVHYYPMPTLKRDAFLLPVWMVAQHGHGSLSSVSSLHSTTLNVSTFAANALSPKHLFLSRQRHHLVELSANLWRFRSAVPNPVAQRSTDDMQMMSRRHQIEWCEYELDQLASCGLPRGSRDRLTQSL
jgi:hypothetical protein